MLQPLVRLVVLNHNGGDMTFKCLEHIAALDWPADRLQAVLIDNASTDGLVERVRRERPDVTVIETGANLGFPANNHGMRDLDGVDYVGLVNNDAFVEPGWLTPLVAALEADAGLGAVSSKVVFDTTSTALDPDADPGQPVINNVGSVVFTDGYGADRGYLQPDDGRFDEPAEVFAWCGASVLFRPEYLEQVGLFEERFFLYYEDIDMSWRGQAAGWRYRYVPESVIHHIHSASSVEGSPLFAHYVERNRLLMLIRNAPAPLAAQAMVRYLTATLSYLWSEAVRPLLARRRPSFVVVRRRARSFLAVLRHLPWALTERRRLRRLQTIPDSVLQTRLTPR